MVVIPSQYHSLSVTFFWGGSVYVVHSEFKKVSFYLVHEQAVSIQCFELYKNLQGLRLGKENFGYGFSYG